MKWNEREVKGNKRTEEDNMHNNQEEAIGRDFSSSSPPDDSGISNHRRVPAPSRPHLRLPPSLTVNRHRQQKKSHVHRSSSSSVTVVYVYGTFVAVVVIVVIELTTVLRSSGRGRGRNSSGSNGGRSYKISHGQASALQELLRQQQEEDSPSSDSLDSSPLSPPPPPPPPYSLRQNRSFFQSLPCIMEWVNTTQRLYHHEMVGDCNDEWAYMHVLKAGGTTIQQQCNTSSFAVGFENPVFLTHILFTFVRDPIDHFIAGFKESASRPGGSSYQPTNESISRYLERKLNNSNFQHSVPQIEYLIYHPPPPPPRRNNNNRNLPSMSRRRPTTTTRPPDDNISSSSSSEMLLPDMSPERYLKRIKFVGEMKDMEKFMKHQHLPWNETLVEKRHYETKRRFDGLRNKLSMDVLENICEYKMIDYCFFDFDPPDVCKDMVESFCQRTCRRQQEEEQEDQEDQDDNNEEDNKEDDEEVVVSKTK